MASKILITLLVAVAVSSAARSGPYLPSGWKPQGPSFYLPGEVKETTVPIEIQVEAEAEGSDALREYGPPKEVSQDLTKQELPEISTEQAFVVIDLTPSVKENIVEDEEVQKTIQQQEDSNIVTEVQEKEGEVEIKETNVENIADALTSLENEIKQQVVENEQVVEVKTVEEKAEIQQVPEGFVEYGPPGFKEYGAPKFEDIRPLSQAVLDVRTSSAVEEKIEPVVVDARRRRFSPKFRLVRKSH